MGLMTMSDEGTDVFQTWTRLRHNVRVCAKKVPGIDPDPCADALGQPATAGRICRVSRASRPVRRRDPAGASSGLLREGRGTKRPGKRAVLLTGEQKLIELPDLLQAARLVERPGPALRRTVSCATRERRGALWRRSDRASLPGALTTGP